jgi:dCMP deaminase
MTSLMATSPMCTWRKRLVSTDRLSWHEYFIGIAYAVAKRADCSRRQVGAVIVDSSNRIVSTGYNGAASKRPGCLDGHCPRANSAVEAGSSYDTGPGSCIALHAEQNAIIYAGQAKCVGSTLYITDFPCRGCLRMIVAAGLSMALWPSPDNPDLFEFISY